MGVVRVAEGAENPGEPLALSPDLRLVPACVRELAALMPGRAWRHSHGDTKR